MRHHTTDPGERAWAVAERDGDRQGEDARELMELPERLREVYLREFAEGGEQ